MNIILIVIDTLRYDYLGANGNPWIRTPNIDRLAARSLVFDRAFAASYPTIPHRTDVMTGLYGGPFNQWAPLRFDIPTLPRLLSEEAGYCTQLIHDTPHLVNGGHAFDWPFHGWTFIRGAEVDRPWIDDRPFEYLDNWARDPEFDFLGDSFMKKPPDITLVTYTRANRNRHKQEDWSTAKLFQTASDWLRDNRSRDKFFLWLDCFSPHAPLDSPPEFVRLYDSTPGYDGRIDPRSFFIGADIEMNKKLSPIGSERMKAFYAAKVSFVDHWLGLLLDTLEQTGLDRNTTIVLTSDHGTCMGENRIFTKRVFSEVGEQEAHVPLLVSVPGMPAGRSSQFAQPQDIFATILGLGGLAHTDIADGQNLLAPGQERQLAITGGSANFWFWKGQAASSLFTVFGDRHYLNLSVHPGESRLFRYGSLEDEAAAHPEVVQNLWQAGLEEAGRRGMDERLTAWIRGNGAGPYPHDLAQWEVPSGFRAYWDRIYNRWD
jgi:arylsulfatase A-like enzyme